MFCYLSLRGSIVTGRHNVTTHIAKEPAEQKILSNCLRWEMEAISYASIFSSNYKFFLSVDLKNAKYNSFPVYKHLILCIFRKIEVSENTL